MLKRNILVFLYTILFSSIALSSGSHLNLDKANVNVKDYASLQEVLKYI
jgi:hypothetical protein